VSLCLRCHRPLRNPSPTGYGPVCARIRGAAAPASVERDLLGYEIEDAVRVARYRVQVLIDGMAAEARIAVRHAFAAARRRLGVRA
jgi:hypothetical protein